MTQAKRKMTQAVLRNMILMACPTINLDDLDIKLNLMTNEELFKAYKKHLGM